MSTITITRDGVSKILPIGFSWTTLIFGYWPSLFRGHWPFFFLAIAVDWASLLFSILALDCNDYFASYVAARIVVAWCRNGAWLKYMIADGWRVCTQYNKPTLVYDSE